MGRGQGSEAEFGGAGVLRSDSVDPDSPYARSVSRRPDPEFASVSLDTYRYGEESIELRSGAAPFDEQMRVFDDHDVFTEAGAWIGADRPVPHRRMTNGALTELGPNTAKVLFDRYEGGDYGDGGEAGFAIYRIGAQTVYLVDDAARSLEGEPPLRDPSTSPGPQTLMLSDDY